MLQQMLETILKIGRTLMLLPFMLGTAIAADVTAFDNARFDALQKEGKPILVDIHANWCPTCRAQAPIIEALARSAEFKEIAVMRVDYDDQKDVVKRLKATSQSTLIVFKGGREVGRSTGDTRKDSIAALMKKAL